MILGNQVEWALHCMVILSGAENGKLISTKALSEFHGVPKEYLSKSLQLLSKAGLVNAVTGPNGGYTLIKLPHEISFLDVVEAVEGKTKTFRCQEIRRNNPCLGKGDKNFSHTCEIAAVMYEADEAWRDSLRSKKLSHITEALSKRLSKKTLAAVSEWFE